MRQYRVVRDLWSHLEPADSLAGSEGLQVGALITEHDGSSHVELSSVELAPGGHVAAHLHPFEESFYLLSGEVLLAIGDRRYTLTANDFGFVPVSTAHAWHNVSDAPARWYRVRSPQPRPIGRSDGTYPLSSPELPTTGDPVAELDPLRPYVGHFSDDDLPPPGPLQMPGAHGHDIRNVSTRMMVDDVLGAIHHQLFMVQFEPSEDPGFSGAAHYHDFEEAYLVLSGHGEVELEGERFDAGPGDLVWENAGTLHAWTARGSQPLRFIELMAPRPPYMNMLFPERTWRELGERTLGEQPDGTS